jgi:hypothetical protein
MNVPKGSLGAGLVSRYDHLEYKYVIRNPDGEVVAWKPGANCQLELQEAKQVEVSDSWCGSMHDVKVRALHPACGGCTAFGKCPE